MSIDVDLRLPALEDAFLRTFGRLPGPEEEDVVEDFAGLAVEAILAVWPVDTGESALGWMAEPIPSPAIGLRLFNGVEYAQYVHLSGESPALPLWEVLVDELSERLPGPLGEALWTSARTALGGGGMPQIVRATAPPPAFPAEVIVYAGRE